MVDRRLILGGLAIFFREALDDSGARSYTRIMMNTTTQTTLTATLHPRKGAIEIFSTSKGWFVSTGTSTTTPATVTGPFRTRAIAQQNTGL